jgi:DNA primase
VSTIDEIKANLDIVDVISDTVALKKSGRSYTGFCPFHPNTRTPSFVVFPETQTWRCFGACAEGGDLFSFVMKREGYDFKEALHALADRAGIQLEVNPPNAEHDEQHHKFLELHVAAAAYFHQLLTASPAGAKVRDYLTKRELTGETITTFQLGYALDEWEALKNHFVKRGYTPAELLAAGLIVERDDRSPGYDRFRYRLMIPIRNGKGQVIGFGARALGANQVPKYLNSPQTRLFDKSKTLYGLDLARNHIRATDQAIIVEGYMDVIQAYQQGAKNVVAQMGTALTEQQLKMLKRLTNNFVLALDSDAAGSAATLRGLNVARKALDQETVPVPTAAGLIRYEGRLNADIRIAALPAGKDPDDILRQGLDVWQATIEEAVPVVDFYFQTVTSQLDLETAKGKSAAVRELIPILRDISDQIEQKHYLLKLANLIRIDERTLRAELQEVQSTSSVKQRLPQQPAQPELPPEQLVTTATSPRINAASARLEVYCLGLILANPGALLAAHNILEKQNIQGLTVEDLNHTNNKEIFKALLLWTVSQEPKLDVLVEMVGETLAPYLANLASQWHNRPQVPDEDIDRDLSLAILRLRLQNVTDQINELTFLQRETDENQNPDSMHHYTQLVEQFMQQRKKLDHIRDALSLMGQRRLETNQYGKVTQ